ncbi:MAG: hypothetical protein KAJ19_24455 [Gammaproteobacteria bacterium]|nr:hypothetical protein [Gammaproteobacteria bacterium]
MKRVEKKKKYMLTSHFAVRPNHSQDITLSSAIDLRNRSDKKFHQGYLPPAKSRLR